MGVELLIIDGIYNAPERRVADCTPEPDSQMAGGEADAHAGGPAKPFPLSANPAEPTTRQLGKPR